jgi:hypothetical protein
MLLLQKPRCGGGLEEKEKRLTQMRKHSRKGIGEDVVVAKTTAW